MPPQNNNNGRGIINPIRIQPAPIPQVVQEIEVVEREELINDDVDARDGQWRELSYEGDYKCCNYARRIKCFEHEETMKIKFISLSEGGGKY